MSGDQGVISIRCRNSLLNASHWRERLLRGSLVLLPSKHTESLWCCAIAPLLCAATASAVRDAQGTSRGPADLEFTLTSMQDRADAMPLAG